MLGVVSRVAFVRLLAGPPRGFRHTPSSPAAFICLARLIPRVPKQGTLVANSDVTITLFDVLSPSW